MIEIGTYEGRRSCRCPYCDDVVWIRRDGCLRAHRCVGDGRRVAEPLPPRRRAAAPAPRTRLDPPAKRCEARARKGTGTGSCDLPLDERGYCPRANDHVEEG